MARKTSQNEQIYRYLQENGSITPIDALNLCGCLRLASRIADLKRIMGADIRTEMESTGTSRYARYRLIEKPVEGGENA